MSSRDGIVMYQMEKERRAEMLAEYGPESYRKHRRELPGFSLAFTPALAKITLILTSLSVIALLAVKVL
jgi:hypothetical protein